MQSCIFTREHFSDLDEEMSMQRRNRDQRRQGDGLIIVVQVREKAFREMKKRCRDDHCSKK